MPNGGLYRKTHCCAVKPEIRKRPCHRGPILSCWRYNAPHELNSAVLPVFLTCTEAMPGYLEPLVNYVQRLCHLRSIRNQKERTPATYHSSTAIEGSTGIYFGMVLLCSKEAFCLYTVIQHL